MAHRHQQAQELKSRYVGSGFPTYSLLPPHHQPHLQVQGVESSSTTPRGYTHPTGVVVYTGFQPKPSYEDKPPRADDHFSIPPSSTSLWHDNFHNNNNTNRSLFGEEESSTRCVFPCEGNERPSQGLSLSLSSDNPSTIGLQSFELRQAHHQQHHIHPQGDYRDGFGGKSGFHHHHSSTQDQLLLQVHMQQVEGVRGSKYLVPAQELLTELCSHGSTPQSTSSDDHHHGDDEIHRQAKNIKKNKGIIMLGDGQGTAKPSLFGVDLIQLQKRKQKLFTMLDELNKRYKSYKDKMKAVGRSFEAVAGDGAASAYTSGAMSRHFRRLKDGLVEQIKAVVAALEAAGGGGGETTPRLRALDQALRHQKAALQQMGMGMGMGPESHPWRPQRGLPEKAVSVLRAWLFEHFLHPYPSDVDKHILAHQTGLSRSQVSNWFINARVRLWKPMVEEMYLEEEKEEQLIHSHTAASSSSPTAVVISGSSHRGGSAITAAEIPQDMLIQEDQKPALDQRIDFESLSAIVSTSHHHYHHHHHEGFGGAASMETLEFSPYNGHMNPPAGSNISLTLGLQQQEGVRFAPLGPPGLVFYPGGDGVEYSVLHGEDDEQGQKLPYENLIGAQLLRDFD